MRSRPASPAIAFVIAAGTAITACGSEELFEPQLGATERLIGREAVARLGKDDQSLWQLVVVGDLDGDGIDDAVLPSYYFVRRPDGSTVSGEDVYVVYGRRNVTGEIDLSTVPSLVGGGGRIAALGDVDGDGLADFLMGVDPLSGCDPSDPPAGGEGHSGAYLVYGSATRLTPGTRLADTGVFLRAAALCTISSGVTGLGDLDGDGKADFAITRSGYQPGSGPTDVLVFYGRGQRLSGTVDLASTADAVIIAPTPAMISSPQLLRAGDVDGDGYGDFVLQMQLTPATVDVRLVQGAATRMAGTVALGDIARSRFVDGDRPLYVADLGAALGDLDGDGFDDFALGLIVGNPDPPFEAIVVDRVFYGRSGGFPAQVGPADADALIRVSSKLASGDVDGDGIRDLILSDPGLHDANGGVQVIRGNGVRLSGNVELAGQGTTYVGQPVRGTRCEYVSSRDCVAHEEVGADLGVGDLTGDHRADILVSAPTDQAFSPELGVHGSALGHVYLVSPSGGAKP